MKGKTIVVYVPGFTDKISDLSPGLWINCLSCTICEKKSYFI